MIQREVLKRVDDGMYDRKREKEETEKGNTIGEIMETGERQRDRETERERKERGEVLKRPPRDSSITQAPQQSLFHSGMTLSSALSLHWVNRIIALNNYTDIPGKSVLSRKSNSSDEIPMV